MKWIKADKQLPDASTLRVIAWREDQMECCWFSKGNWHVYDGTFFLTDKTKITGVTHWFPVDWMTSKEFPLHGPGIVNKVKHHWQRLTDRAQDMAYDLRPKGWGSKAAMSKKPTFYRDSTGKIMSGMPENLPAPRGYEKIVCGSALEAERYSSIQRQQERVEHRMQQAQRGGIEEAQLAEIRSERRELIKNARNSANRDFLIAANERFDKQHKPWQYERESYLHSEAFEDKH
jgi:hypothetical protein